MNKLYGLLHYDDTVTFGNPNKENHLAIVEVKLFTEPETFPPNTNFNRLLLALQYQEARISYGIGTFYDGTYHFVSSSKTLFFNKHNNYTYHLEYGSVKLLGWFLLPLKKKY